METQLDPTFSLEKKDVFLVKPCTTSSAHYILSSMETQLVTPFSLEKKDVVLVKPLKPTPQDLLTLSTIDNNPTLELLCQTLYVYQANATSADPAFVLKEALSKVLVHYYPLAGKLKRNGDNRQLEITFNGDAIGVPFLEASASCQLSSLCHFDGIDVEIAKQFVFDFPSSDDGYHPLVLQVTRFSCGGFTVGMGLSHAVCDGFGAAQFFQALVELASGKSEPSVNPVWKRERLIGKLSCEHTLLKPLLDPASSATSPHLPTTDLLHECFYVNSECIKKLKTSLLKEINEKESVNEIESFTIVEVLGAYIWRARFKALQMNSDGNTLFCLTMGIRRILNPPLPVGYYGNAFVASNVVLMGRDLTEGPLSSVAKLIKESKKRSSHEDHIRNQLDMLECVRHLGMKMEASGASMVLTDWRQLGLLEQIDFGWKEAVNIIPLPWNMFGYVDLCILLPPCSLDPSMKGGVRVLVCLPKAAMPKFKEEMDGLSKLNSY